MEEDKDINNDVDMSFQNIAVERVRRNTQISLDRWKISTIMGMFVIGEVWYTLFVIWSFFSSDLFSKLVRSALASLNLNKLKHLKVLDALK